MLFAFSSTFLHFKAWPQKAEIILISLYSFNSKWMYIFESQPQSRALKMASVFPIYDFLNKNAILTMLLKTDLSFPAKSSNFEPQSLKWVQITGTKGTGRAPSKHSFPHNLHRPRQAKLNCGDSVVSFSRGKRRKDLLLNLFQKA